MKRLLVLGMLMAMAALAAVANDTAMFGAGGSLRPMDGEHRAIRMVREWVKMDVYPTYYDVAVQFVFHNTGAATAVQMGFPEVNEGDVSIAIVNPGYQNFQTFVDDRRVTVQRQVTPEQAEITVTAYWVKSVSFARGQTRVIRVQYRSRGGSDSMGSRFASYAFTGGNWAGTVENSSLTVALHLPGTYHLDTRDLPMRRQGNRLAFAWRNWQAEAVFAVQYDPTITGAMLLAGPQQEFSLGNQFISVQPGQAQSPSWIPPIIRGSDRIHYVRLGTLAWFLETYARILGREIMVGKLWDSRTQTAHLEVDGKTFTFRVGQRQMMVDGTAVALPGAPFNQPRIGYQYPGVYVPMAPVARELGIGMVIGPNNDTITLLRPTSVAPSTKGD